MIFFKVSENEFALDIKELISNFFINLFRGRLAKLIFKYFHCIWDRVFLFLYRLPANSRLSCALSLWSQTATACATTPEKTSWLYASPPSTTPQRQTPIHWESLCPKPSSICRKSWQVKWRIEPLGVRHLWDGEKSQMLLKIFIITTFTHLPADSKGKIITVFFLINEVTILMFYRKTCIVV